MIARAEDIQEESTSADPVNPDIDVNLYLFYFSDLNTFRLIVVSTFFNQIQMRILRMNLSHLRDLYPQPILSLM